MTLGTYYIILDKTQGLPKGHCPRVGISVSAQVVALKVLHHMPLDPKSDFPIDTAVYTKEQQEDFRREFVGHLSEVFGNPVGWKLALSAADYDNPVLGYTQPAIGQLLDRMIIKGPEARIKNDYAILPFYEVDLFIRVSDDAINDATTPEDIISNIDAVIPAYELPGGFVRSLDELAGPKKDGKGLIPLLNGLARLFVLGDEIPVPGSLSSEQWIERLNNVEGEERVITREKPITRPCKKAPFVTFALTLLSELRVRGHKVHKGDLLGLGFLTGVNKLIGTEREMIATYTNLDPAGPVAVKVIIDNEHGTCFGGAGKAGA